MIEKGSFVRYEGERRYHYREVVEVRGDRFCVIHGWHQLGPMRPGPNGGMTCKLRPLLLWLDKEYLEERDREVFHKEEIK